MSLPLSIFCHYSDKHCHCFGHSVRRPGQFVCPNSDSVCPNSDKKYLTVLTFRFLLLFFAHYEKRDSFLPSGSWIVLFWLPAETLSLKRLRGNPHHPAFFIPPLSFSSLPHGSTRLLPSGGGTCHSPGTADDQRISGGPSILTTCKAIEL